METLITARSFISTCLKQKYRWFFVYRVFFNELLLDQFPVCDGSVWPITYWKHRVWPSETPQMVNESKLLEIAGNIHCVVYNDHDHVVFVTLPKHVVLLLSSRLFNFSIVYYFLFMVGYSLQTCPWPVEKKRNERLILIKLRYRKTVCKIFS